MTGGVEGAECERKEEASFLYFYLFLYHIFVVKVKELAGSACYGENKIQNPKKTKKGNIKPPKCFSWGPYRSQAHRRARN